MCSFFQYKQYQHHTTCIRYQMGNSRRWSTQCFTGENVCWPFKNSRGNFYGTLLFRPQYVYRNLHMYRVRTTGHLHKSKLLISNCVQWDILITRMVLRAKRGGPGLSYITMHTSMQATRDYTCSYTIHTAWCSNWSLRDRAIIGIRPA